MNSNPHNPLLSESPSAEETLRLVASLPAPAGLEDRVHAGLRAAAERGPQRRILVAGVSSRGRVLAWPSRFHPQSSWMRTAAAAAIVFVVAGGGWGVYTHVQRSQPARVIAMPARMPAAGGFSSLGAMRTPETLPGPTAPKPAAANKAQAKGTKKPMTSVKPAGTGQPNASAKTAAQLGAAK